MHFFVFSLPLSSIRSLSNRQPKKGTAVFIGMVLYALAQKYLTATILASHRRTMKFQTKFNSFNFFSIENEAKPIHLFPLIMRTIYYIKIFASLIRAKCLSIYLFFPCGLFFSFFDRNTYFIWTPKKHPTKNRLMQCYAQ